MLLSAAKTAFLVFYLWVVLMVVIYGVHRYVLVMIFYRHRGKTTAPLPRLRRLPRVTVQLPVYNEAFVVERLIEATCGIRYPRELLEIQVLDDSTDETVEIGRACVARMRALGHDIKHIHRDDRMGYKAGALQAGLEQARGEFIAVFDADFVPDRDILERSIHCFSDPTVGMVQVRWAHLNEDHSLLTKGQAIFLDGHFSVEHLARNRSGRFMNFNGTAGVWRREAIETSGAWEHDTLTEDLDLSYRAQLAGWRFVYLPEVTCPAELPVEMNAFKSQQHRWTKGAVQTAKKILPRVLASELPWKVKVEAFFHLTCSTVYVYVFLMSLALWPVLALRFDSTVWSGWRGALVMDIPLLVLASLSAAVFFVASQKEMKGELWKTILYIPFLMCLGIGMSLVNSKAVLEGLIGRRNAWERTPKYGNDRKKVFQRMAKYRGKVTLLPFVELALACYVCLTIHWAYASGHYASLPFLFLFAAGYLYVGTMSLAHSLLGARKVPAHAPS